MTKRVKFETEAQMHQFMGALYTSGKIGGWHHSRAGYVRFQNAVSRVWRDLTEIDLIAMGA